MSYSSIHLHEDHGTGTATKHSKPRYWPSNDDETFVRNAVTGQKYDFRVGSAESRLLYRVVDTTGVCDARGRDLHQSQRPYKACNFLYFDSKEQFQRFFYPQEANRRAAEEWSSATV